MLSDAAGQPLRMRRLICTIGYCANVFYPGDTNIIRLYNTLEIVNRYMNQHDTRYVRLITWSGGGLSRFSSRQ